MSRYDAERALEIYKVFTRQTEDTVEFLQNARRLETATRLQIPNVKHAPTSLTKSLEEYLLDPDFDINRRQYLAAQEAKRTGKKVTAEPSASVSKQPAAATPAANPASSASAPIIAQQAAAPKQENLIDFFASIENEQTPMFGQTPTSAAQPQFSQPATIVVPQIQPPQIITAGPFTGIQQQPGFIIQQPQNPQQPLAQPFLVQNAAPFQMQQPLQTDFTGAGFGGYTPAPQSTISSIPQPIIQTAPAIPQSFTPPIQTPQSTSSLLPAATGSTNPFRQSMMPTGSTISSPITSLGTGSTTASRGTNPFARNSTVPATLPQSTTSFASTATEFSQAPQAPLQFAPQQPQVQPQVQQQPTLLRSATTGSTNPFARPKPADTGLQALSEISEAPSASFLPPQPNNMNATVAPSGLNIPQTTGTNPFRQSRIAADTAPQMPMGGLEHLETIPVFPRSDQQNPQQQQQQGWSGF
ncbi:hypothetical protein ABW19_dt0208870 [Dactylella cylindrospora]|nr:hypothetical protein ABW19_dt0208870 [Dactylella cylindrospora]